MESVSNNAEMISITVDDLKTICRRLSDASARSLLAPLSQCFNEYEINTRNRIAAFIGQLAVESGEFRFKEEIWGPTPVQKLYEPPSRKATMLGNDRKGDGFRYRGRGFIQLTGRANYRQYGRELKLDLEANPDQAAEPLIACRIAGRYWTNHQLNEKADMWDLRAITRAINGGLTHHMERAFYCERARKVLAPVTA